MSPYEKIRPNYYREWLKQKKQKWVNLIVQRLQDAHKKGMITEEESKMEVKLSTKDRLKKMGISVGISDTASLDSFGDNMSTGYDDENEPDLLESEEEDPFGQDEFKGINLAQIPTKRRDMTRAERLRWLDDDGNGNLYKQAINNRIDPKVIERKFWARKHQTDLIRERFSTKNDI